MNRLLSNDSINLFVSGLRMMWSMMMQLVNQRSGCNLEFFNNIYQPGLNNLVAATAIAQLFISNVSNLYRAWNQWQRPHHLNCGTLIRGKNSCNALAWKLSMIESSNCFCHPPDLPHPPPKINCWLQTHNVYWRYPVEVILDQVLMMLRIVWIYLCCLCPLIAMK